MGLPARPLPTLEKVLAQARLLPATEQQRLSELLDGAGPVIGAASPDAEPSLFARGPWDLTEPGAAAYRGKRFPIRGAPRRLLCRLVRARGAAVPCHDLKATAGDPLMMGGTLRGHVSDLRQVLRAALAGRADLPADPVPLADRGEAGGWRLALW
jgi:hypothetical protein